MVARSRTRNFQIERGMALMHSAPIARELYRVLVPRE